MNRIVPQARFLARLPQVGVSKARIPDEAVGEAAAQLDLTSAGLVLVFVPSGLDLDRTAAALNTHLADLPVYGCTTAGQITPLGYEDGTLMLVALPRAHFRGEASLIHPLRPVSIEGTATVARQLEEALGTKPDWQRLALLFSDGLSKQEDLLVTALEAGLRDTQVFGGSAGNGLAFDETFVFCDGRFYPDAALVLMLETNLPFQGIGFDHFSPTSKQMVVTRAHPEERLVQEINGAPAASEYARLVGCALEDLSPEIFAENPVLVHSGQAWHVRAIQQVEPDGALAFLCAIDDGLVLTLGHGNEILETLDNGLAVRDDHANAPDFILGFDCVLRRLEIEQKNMLAETSQVLRRHRVIGFNTYGEQHCGVHVNQTFVGLAFFRPQEDETA